MAYGVAAFVLALSVVAAIVIVFANGMNNATDKKPYSPWLPIVWGFSVAAVIALTHGATW